MRKGEEKSIKRASVDFHRIVRCPRQGIRVPRIFSIFGGSLCSRDVTLDLYDICCDSRATVTRNGHPWRWFPGICPMNSICVDVPLPPGTPPFPWRYGIYPEARCTFGATYLTLLPPRIPSHLRLITVTATEANKYAFHLLLAEQPYINLVFRAQSITIHAIDANNQMLGSFLSCTNCSSILYHDLPPGTMQMKASIILPLPGDMPSVSTFWI